MYKVRRNKTFKRNVEVAYPGQDGREYTDTLTAEFRIFPAEKIAEWQNLRHAEFVQKVLVSIEMVDEHGKQLSLEEAMSYMLKEDPFAISALSAEYNHCINTNNFRRLRSG